MPAPAFECFLCGRIRPITERVETEIVVGAPVGRNLLPSSSFNPQFWQASGGGAQKDSQGSYPSRRRRKLLENNSFKTLSPIYSLGSGTMCWTDVDVDDGGEWVLNGDVGVVPDVGSVEIVVTVNPPAPPVVNATLRNVGGARAFQFTFAVASAPATVRVQLTGYAQGGRWWFDCLQLRRPEDEFVYTTSGPLFFARPREIRAIVATCAECRDEEISA